jgi:hypothetical protein
MYRETHTITFTKPAKRSLRDDVISGNFTALFNSILTKSMTVRGWNVTEDIKDRDGVTGFWTREDSEDGDYPYSYRAYA